MKEWSLKRTVQCAHCPWKVGVDPYEIPNGYDPEKHENLRKTIAVPGELKLGGLPTMACHETENAHCIGWLNNQLGTGNNITLRLHALRCSNIGDIQVEGPQHPTFDDTLPPEMRQAQDEREP